MFDNFDHVNEHEDVEALKEREREATYWVKCYDTNCDGNETTRKYFQTGSMYFPCAKGYL
jgi:hypothetical protein